MAKNCWVFGDLINLQAYGAAVLSINRQQMRVAK